MTVGDYLHIRFYEQQIPIVSLLKKSKWYVSKNCNCAWPSVDREAAAGINHPRKKKERRARKGPFPLWKLQLLSKTFVLLRHQTFVILSKLQGKKPIVAQKKLRLATKFPMKLPFVIIVSNFWDFKFLSKGGN